jgi:hypothetical protein
MLLAAKPDVLFCSVLLVNGKASRACEPNTINDLQVVTSSNNNKTRQTKAE